MLISKKPFYLSILFSLIFSFYVGNVFCAEKTIYVIESYHAEYPWNASYKNGLEEKLGGKHKPVYFQMDAKNRNKKDRWEHML